MKKFPKLLVLALALALVLVQLLVTAPQANAEVYVADAGQTVTIYLDYTNICAIDGEISISDSSIISQYEYDQSQSGMSGLVEGGKFFLYAEDQTGVSGRIGVTLTIFSGAIKGSSCTVTFRYTATTPGSTTPGSIQTVTHTVTVRTEGMPTVVPTEPPTPSTEPSIHYADTSALRSQLEIAQNLKYYDYTKESWAEVQAAVEEGQNILSSTNQSAVDKATAKLKTALENLIPMDYSALMEALENAADMNKHEAIATLWSSFILALNNARQQLTSGDQAAVDAAAQELNGAKVALQNGLEELGELIVVEKEVKVEVEPSYSFCNNVHHNLFLILMLVSIVANVALVLLIVLYRQAKRRREWDDTPLVDYHEDEDELEINEDLLD